MRYDKQNLYLYRERRRGNLLKNRRMIIIVSHDTHYAYWKFIEQVLFGPLEGAPVTHTLYAIIYPFT